LKITKHLFPKWHLKDKYLGVLYVLPAMFVLLGMTLYPFLYCINLSLQKWDLFQPNKRYYIGFTNYISLFIDPNFWNSLKTTIIFTVVSVIVSFIIGLVLASLLAGKGRFVGAFRTIFVLPMIITPIVIGTGFKYLYDPTSGILNYVLSLIRITAPAWTTNPKTALLSVIMVDIWQWTPFMFLILIAGIQGLPKAPFEAAACDGASYWQILKNVTFPLMKPVVLIALLFRAIDSFRTFDTIYAITSGGPGMLTTTLNLFAYIKAFKMYRMGEAAAVAIIIWTIVFIFSQLLLKYLSTQKVVQGK